VFTCAAVPHRHSTQCDNYAGRFDILSDWNKQEKVKQNFQEERASCHAHSMALSDRNIAAGGALISGRSATGCPEGESIG
jgi:hypothetical protein